MKCDFDKEKECNIDASITIHAQKVSTERAGRSREDLIVQQVKKIIIKFVKNSSTRGEHKNPYCYNSAQR